MKGTKEKTTKRRRRLMYPADEGVQTVQRKLTLPVELDTFLTTYARREGFNSEVQAVYQLIRERKATFEPMSG